MEKILIRKPYDLSMPVRKSFPKTTMAKQSSQAECDINTIMSKYQKTGLIDHTNNIQGHFGDFTNVEDYHLSINRVLAAQEAFASMPSSIRARFGNDPAQFLGFIENPDNRAEAVELGLIEPTSQTPDISAEGGKSKPSEELKEVDPGTDQKKPASKKSQD